MGSTSRTPASASRSPRPVSFSRADEQALLRIRLADCIAAVISQRLLGTREIVVIHHTDCGMLTFTNEQLAEQVKRELGVDVAGRDFLPFSNVEQSVRDDVETLRRSPLIPREIPISGAVYDVRTGALQVVPIDPTRAQAVPVG